MDLMAILGPKSYCYRASCQSVEIKLRVDPDAAWMAIKRPGQETQYRDVPRGDVDSVLQEFEAIGESVEGFNSFIAAR